PSSRRAERPDVHQNPFLRARNPSPVASISDLDQVLAAAQKSGFNAWYPPSSSSCPEKAGTQVPSPGGVLADEGLHAVNPAGGVWGVGLAGHNAVIGALIELQFGLAAGLLVIGDEFAHDLDRHPFVAVAAEYQRRRQVDLLATFEDPRRVALGHRRPVAPEI